MFFSDILMFFLCFGLMMHGYFTLICHCVAKHLAVHRLSVCCLFLDVTCIRVCFNVICGFQLLVCQLLT